MNNNEFIEDINKWIKDKEGWIKGRVAETIIERLFIDLGFYVINFGK